MNDPAIKNKQEIIDDFHAEVVMIKTETEKTRYLRMQYSIMAEQELSNERNVEQEEDDIADNISEASSD